MQRLPHVLWTLALGMVLIGVVLGTRDIGVCGSVFAPNGGCDDRLTTHQSMVIAFMGMGVTCLLAGFVADAKPPKYPDKRLDDEDE